MTLREAIDTYHALLDAHAAREAWLHIDREERARRMLVGKARDRLVCSVLRPRFITQAQYDALQRAATLVGRAIGRVGAATLRDETLLAPYALTGMERELLSIDAGYAGASVFGRLDGFLAADGSACWFVESNLESPAGIAYDEALVEIFSELPVMQAFLRERPARPFPVRERLHKLLLDTYAAWGGTGAPTIGIVDYRSAVTWPEFEHLKGKFDAAGTPTVLADPGDLRYDGQRLYAGDTAIDLVYRRVLQHEFLARYDLSHPLVRAYADGKVCVVNPFRSKPVHTKLIMALLSDEEGAAHALLSDEERAAVAAHVPWSRHVRAGASTYAGERLDDLVGFIERNRERLVLKPNDDYGGSGVLLGWVCSDDEWRAGLAAAERGPWVVQERVPVPEEDYPTWSDASGFEITPRYVDSDPCVYGAEALGCLTRIAATPLLNVSAGGGAAPPTFLLEDV